MGRAQSTLIQQCFGFDKEKEMVEKYSAKPTDGVVICDAPGLLIHPLSYGRQMPHSDLATFGIYTFLVCATHFSFNYWSLILLIVIVVFIARY